MALRIWLDDEREMPEGFNFHARIYADVAELLEKGFEIECISFDHDLGTEATGYDVAVLFESLAESGLGIPVEWDVHSDNPPGRKRITAAMRSAERYWKRSKHG